MTIRKREWQAHSVRQDNCVKCFYNGSYNHRRARRLANKRVRRFFKKFDSHV